MKVEALREEKKEGCSLSLVGSIDIKKHCASSHCFFYDVMLYRHFKVSPHTGRLYSKKTLEEVRQLLLQGNFQPNVLSEQLFDKILAREK